MGKRSRFGVIQAPVPSPALSCTNQQTKINPWRSRVQNTHTHTHTHDENRKQEQSKKSGETHTDTHTHTHTHTIYEIKTGTTVTECRSPCQSESPPRSRQKNECETQPSNPTHEDMHCCTVQRSQWRPTRRRKTRVYPSIGPTDSSTAASECARATNTPEANRQLPREE